MMHAGAGAEPEQSGVIIAAPLSSRNNVNADSTEIRWPTGPAQHALPVHPVGDL
jgi:hypothetical protein